MTTDPLDRVISAMWATRPSAAAPLRPVPVTGKCPTCRYLVEPPCAVCAQQAAVTSCATEADLLRAALGPPRARPLAPKAQAILDAAVAWVQAHPLEPLTVAAMEGARTFPFSKSHVYKHFGTCVVLNRRARALAFPEEDDV